MTVLKTLLILYVSPFIARLHCIDHYSQGSLISLFSVSSVETAKIFGGVRGNFAAILVRVVEPRICFKLLLPVVSGVWCVSIIILDVVSGVYL